MFYTHFCTRYWTTDGYRNIIELENVCKISWDISILLPRENVGNQMVYIYENYYSEVISIVTSEN